jgi:hypothetical protein
MTIGLVLTILFVLLKAFGKIDWSWWLVFLPLIIEGGLELLFFGFIVRFIRKITR